MELGSPVHQHKGPWIYLFPCSVYLNIFFHLHGLKMAANPQGISFKFQARRRVRKRGEESGVVKVMCHDFASFKTLF